MANIPTPRSFSQIIGDMLDTFVSRYGLTTILPGTPVDAILGAAAQSDLRSSQDLFTFLNAQSLDRAVGTALLRIGADEGVRLQTESAASGLVTISDNSSTRKASKIYQGQPAPIVGSGSLYILDASAFPSSGSVYVGRGTSNYEGPLDYTAKTLLGTYWRLDLASGSKTKKFHNLSETVVLAQGGDRPINAGTVVQTAQGNVTEAARYATLYPATIIDGETEVTGVTVVAQKPGLSGNVPAGAINQFVTKPFAGAEVTNPLPFTNALPTWDAKTYREAIKAARQSRARGTALAIKTAATGVTSSEDSKRVTSASLVVRTGAPSTLYIDDGTGYEERSQGVAIETLTGSALGGERWFQVASPRPITKANTVTSLEAPFALKTGMVLAVKVGGILEKHTFSATEFRSIANGGADEIVASINADTQISFQARLVSNGSRLTLFASGDSNEDLEVVGVDADEQDANEALGFPAGRQDTMRLYLNDRLLSKDGQQALVVSERQGSWSAISSGDTLTLKVDGTTAVAYTFTDADFINAGTGYNTVAATNSLDSWAKVFNAKIPGITAMAGAGLLTLVSNLGPTGRAQILISGGTLVSAGMFSFNTATGLLGQGKDRDYTLDRSTGQLRLESVLAAGDRLTIGSPSTRAFTQSSALATVTLSSQADLWFVVDGEAQLISTGLTAGSSVTLSEYVLTPPATWGKRVRTTATSGTFTNLKAGDWAIFLDSGLSAGNQGAYRVAYVSGSGDYFEVEKSALTAETVALLGGGIVFVRSEANLQKVSLSAASNYTAASLATAIAAQLRGSTAETWRTTRLRIRTQTFSLDGDLALVAQNTEAMKLGLSTASAVTNLTSHLAAVVSAGQEIGTPAFGLSTSLASVGSPTSINLVSSTGWNPGLLPYWLRSLPDVDGGGSRSRQGSNTGYWTPVTAISGSTLTLRRAALQEWLPSDRVIARAPLAISASDDLTVLVDGDTASKRYTMNLYRNTKPTGSTYSTTITVTDSDNGDQSLAVGFGTGFSWKDFAVWMRARAKSHAESGDTTATVLWRAKRFGPDGNALRLRYVYPSAPSQAVAVISQANAAGFSQQSLISVALASGAAKSGYTLRNTSRIGVMSTTAGSLQGLTYIFGFTINSATRVVKLDYTGRNTAAFTGTVTGGTSGATATVSADTLAGGSTGAGTLTITTVVGTFIPGETITAGSASATLGRQYGVTSLNLDVANPGATDHGFAVSDQIWVKSTDVNFSTGVKTLTARTTTTVSYEEGSTAATGGPIGNVSADTAGEVTFVGGTVTAGDIIKLGSITGLPASYQGPWQTTFVSAQWAIARAETSNSTGTVPTWYSVLDTSAVSFYPLASNTATSVASAVNALTQAPVTAVAVGTGGVSTGAITKASFDDFSSPGYVYPLTDGINWVASHSTPVDTVTNYDLTLKQAVTASLATNSDWQNEIVRLVPTLAQSAVDFMATQAVSGLSSSAEVATANEFSGVQISSLTPGSGGSVQVQGGSGNALSATVIGSSTLLTGGSQAMVTVAASDVVGLAADMWTEVQNQLPMPKDSFTSATSCTSIDTAGNFVISGTQAWAYANTATGKIDGMEWQIERVGRYTAFRWSGIGSSPNLAGIQEGDWVVIATGAYSVSSRNTGTFRVIRCDNTAKVFWLENPNSAAEVVTASLWFMTYDSLMPGDRLSISTTLWGAGNQGVWTVKALNSGSVYGFSVDVSSKATATFTGPQALGSQSSLVQCLEGAATKLVKQVLSVTQNDSDATLADIKFTTSAGYKKIGSSAGTLVQAVGKLAFPTVLAQGIDGYSHSTGLIAEVARVLYGDESDPATYPGVIAAGSNLNISGPLVKRIQLGLGIRIKSGISTTDVVDRVQSVVASVINKTGIGQSIAISDIVAAAGSVYGVVAITVLSPSYGAGTDLISVQPDEKPLVLDLDQDISVSLVGD
jgi:hypothetical protein